MAITPITVYQVEGFSTTKTFSTLQEAERFEQSQHLGKHLDVNLSFIDSDLARDDAYSVAAYITDNYILIPRSVPVPEMIQLFRLKTGLIAEQSTVTFAEWLLNDYQK